VEPTGSPYMSAKARPDSATAAVVAVAATADKCWRGSVEINEEPIQ
jgi:hypothetical protein